MPESIINYDSQASPAHTHVCTNPQHTPVRVWTCTQANCLRIHAWSECEQCRPRVPPPPPYRAGCPCPSRVTALLLSVWT
jgi:hypothetical protein